jgi:hypothetical protein
MDSVVTWLEFSEAEPELAAAVRAAFDADRHAVLATLRRDGSPRVSGVEPVFYEGDVWLFVMPGSVKSADLQHDPRCALHSATSERRCGRHNPAGAATLLADDAKITGRAVVADPAASARLLDFLRTHTDLPPASSPELLRIDLDEVSTVRATEDAATIHSWRAGQPARTRHRR